MYYEEEPAIIGPRPACTGQDIWLAVCVRTKDEQKTGNRNVVKHLEAAGSERSPELKSGWGTPLVIHATSVVCHNFLHQHRVALCCDPEIWALVSGLRTLHAAHTKPACHQGSAVANDLRM